MPIQYATTADRPLLRALTRGFAGRCPACGRGKLFRAFLKTADQCPACGTELHHHQADDAPPYFVILVVGHIIVPLVLTLEVALRPPIWVHMAIWIPLTLLLAVLLLPRVKGAIVGLQWALRMHGFSAGGMTDAPVLPGREAGEIRG
jgi:uncharacterized protein (DUF983 family)